MPLTGKQRRFLRAKGHNLSAIVSMGKEGISPAFLAAVDRALLDHELIKVRIGRSALVEREQAATEVTTKTQSELAQILGNTLLLYRPHPDEPRLVLP